MLYAMKKSARVIFVLLCLALVSILLIIERYRMKTLQPAKTNAGTLNQWRTEVESSTHGEVERVMVSDVKDEKGAVAAHTGEETSDDKDSVSSMVPQTPVEVDTSTPAMIGSNEALAQLDKEDVAAHRQHAGPVVERTAAYCVKCHEKRIMQNARKITTKNGRNAMEGICPVCGTKLFRFIANEKE